MHEYRQLVRTRGVWRLLAGVMPARLAYAMVPLAIFFAAREHHGSLALAGLAVGVNTLTSSACAALRGGWVDRRGQTAPLLWLVPAYSLGLFVLAAAGDDPTIFVGLCALVGLVAPPINMSARPLWKSLVRPDQVRTAWAFDSVLLQTMHVVGPAIATLLAQVMSPDVALVACGVLMLTGGLLMVVSPDSRAWVGEPRDPAEPGLLRSTAMRIMCLEGLALGVSFGALEIAVPSAASLSGHPSRSAALLGVFALGSVLGGIRAGTRQSRGIAPLSGLMRANTAMAVTLLLLPWVGAYIGMGAVLLVAGFAFGPAHVFWLEVIDQIRPRGTAVASLGFLWTVEGAAAAVGSALAGQLAQSHGARPTLLFVSITAFGSPLVLVLGRRVLTRSGAGTGPARNTPRDSALLAESAA